MVEGGSVCCWRCLSSCARTSARICRTTLPQMKWVASQCPGKQDAIFCKSKSKVNRVRRSHACSDRHYNTHEEKEINENQDAHRCKLLLEGRSYSNHKTVSSFHCSKCNSIWCVCVCVSSRIILKCIQIHIQMTIGKFLFEIVIWCRKL